MSFENDERAQAGPFRSENHSAGRKSVAIATCRQNRGAPPSPHGDFGDFATLVRLTRARPAAQGFFAKRPDLRWRRQKISERDYAEAGHYVERKLPFLFWKPCPPG